MVGYLAVEYLFKHLLLSDYSGDPATQLFVDSILKDHAFNSSVYPFPSEFTKESLSGEPKVVVNIYQGFYSMTINDQTSKYVW